MSLGRLASPHAKLRTRTGAVVQSRGVNRFQKARGSRDRTSVSHVDQNEDVSALMCSVLMSG